ncbi:hypothetical protein [Acrocarpospora sp. B8E8]|uniref:hypothetical protein n=1 Tax=Acrocarpospora sp. B8E8 TaxID=3153572 RepID=UPI00325C6DDC
MSHVPDFAAAAAVVREMDAAVPAQGHGTCRHCDGPIVFKPYWLDGKLPNPPIWFHPDSGTTCNTRPKGWPADSWPHAEPLPATTKEADRPFTDYDDFEVMADLAVLTIGCDEPKCTARTTFEGEWFASLGDVIPAAAEHVHVFAASIPENAEADR